MASRQHERSRSPERHRRRSTNNHGGRDARDRRHRSRERDEAGGNRPTHGRDADRRHEQHARDERHHDADVGHSRHSRHGSDRRERVTSNGGRADGSGHRGRRADARGGDNVRQPANGAAVLDAMVPAKPAAQSASATAGMPRSQVAAGHNARRPLPPPPAQQPPPDPAPSADQQPGAQQPVRINRQGIYTRAIEEYDYVVPRGGYFFEHDDRDVITFKEEMQRPRNGAAALSNPVAANGAAQGRSFVAEDPSDRWDEARRPPPPRQRGRDWGDSEAAEPMGRERLGRRGGASEGIFGQHRGGDDRGSGARQYRGAGGGTPWDHGGRSGGWQGSRGRGGGGGGFGGGGKWAHDMFETLSAAPEEAPAA